MDRDQLAEFLRSRRARVQPADVGLAAGYPRAARPACAARRSPGSPGSRSTTTPGWNRRAGRARPGRCSPRWPGRCGCTTPSARYLYPPGRRGARPADRPEPGRVRRRPAPARPARRHPGVRHRREVRDPRLEPDGRRPAGRPVGRPPGRRNMVWNLFAGEYSALAWPTRPPPSFADECVAELRAASVRYPADEGIRSLIARLRAVSADFTRRWDEHQVCVRRSTSKRLDHPLHGRLVFTPARCSTSPTPARR